LGLYLTLCPEAFAGLLGEYTVQWIEEGNAARKTGVFFLTFFISIIALIFAILLIFFAGWGAVVGVHKSRE
jgi:hypothetical protein